MMAQKRLLLGAIAAAFIMLAVPAALSQEYKSGDPLELLVTNATDGTLMAGEDCLMSIFNQSAAVYVNETMNDTGTGVYNFTLNASIVPQPGQPYKARVVCSIGGADWTDEMLFFVISDTYIEKLDALPTSCGQGSSNLTVCGQGSSNLTETDVMTQANFTDLYNGTLSQVQACGSGASNLTECGQGSSNLTDTEVWEYAERTLTQNITGNFSEEGAAAAVWNHATRTLTAFTFGVNVTDEALGNIATAVWSAGARTLTSFGTLVDDAAAAVWAYATRELTGFGTLVTDIWASATRTLTSVSITNATQQQQLENASANVTVGVTNTYNTDNSTFNIILPISD